MSKFSTKLAVALGIMAIVAPAADARAVTFKEAHTARHFAVDSQHVNARVGRTAVRFRGASHSW